MTTPPRLRTLAAPNFPVPEMHTVYPVIGHPRYYEEITTAIQKHGNSPETIPFQTSFQEARMPIHSSLFKLNPADHKLNNDTFADFLLVRSLEVFHFPGMEDKRGAVSLLVFVPGNEQSEEKGEPTETMIQNGWLLSAAYLKGEGHPIAGLRFTDSNQDGLEELRWTELGDERVFDPAQGRPRLNDQRLFDALFAAQAFFANQIGYLDILNAVNDIGTLANEAQKKSVTLFYNQLGVGFKTLEKCYQAAVRDSKLKAKYEARDPDFLPLARAMVYDANQVLTLPKEALDQMAEWSAAAQKEMDGALKAFRWQEGEWADKPMERAEFYNLIRDLEDPAKRRDLTEKYSAAVVQAHRKGLFTMIPKLNTLARKHGFESYPGYYDQTFYGMTPADFARLADDYHRQFGASIAGYIRELQAVNGGQPVHEWDVDHLSQKLIREKTGGELPKLTFEEAFAIAKRWFKDIGWDLDQPPFRGKIFFDMKKRENKFGNAFAAALEDGSRAWFNTNFDPNEKISLKDLNTIIHELTHNAQYIYGAQKGRGNLVTGAGASPRTWIEGSAFTMGDIVYNRAWMDRYLSHLPEFQKREVRATAAAVLEKQQHYTNMMVLCRALWENNLYQDKNPDGTPRSLEERLRFREVIARKYLHIEAMDATQGGYIYATPHFAVSPGYYVAYGGGRPLGAQAMEVLYEGLANGDEKRLRRGGAVFRAVLEEGARNLTATDLQAAIARVNKRRVSQ